MKTCLLTLLALSCLSCLSSGILHAETQEDFGKNFVVEWDTYVSFLSVDDTNLQTRVSTYNRDNGKLLVFYTGSSVYLPRQKRLLVNALSSTIWGPRATQWAPDNFHIHIKETRDKQTKQTTRVETVHIVDRFGRANDGMLVEANRYDADIFGRRGLVDGIVHDNCVPLIDEQGNLVAPPPEPGAEGF